MDTGSPSGENRLTIDLPEDVAERLKLAAVARKRTASAVAVELLDKHLPRLRADEKKNIPYS